MENDILKNNPIINDDDNNNINNNDNNINNNDNNINNNDNNIYNDDNNIDNDINNINIINNDKDNNIDNNINNSGNILSSIYIDYHHHNSGEDEIKKRNTTVCILNEDFRRNSIYDLNINLNDDFSNIILAKLDEMQKNTETQFTNLFNQYENCFNDYKKRIIDYLKKAENNISKVIQEPPNNDNLLQYVDRNIFNKINCLTAIYDNIVNNIESNFDLLNKFLMEKDLIIKQTPLEDFLFNNSEMIYNCSLLTKFNFEEINTTNISKINYYNKFLQFLNSEKKYESIKSYIIKKDNIKEGIEYIKKKSELKNIYINDVGEENFPTIINTITKNKSLLDLIEIKNCNFKLEKDEKSKKKLVGNIFSKTVNIIHGKLNYLKIKELSQRFIIDNEFLVNLSIEKVGMTNTGFLFLMTNFYKNEKMVEKLEYLSLSGNVITSINAEIEKNRKKIFKNLKIFDLSNNEIYTFEMSFNKFPSLKCLDLSSNNIPISTLMDNIIRQEKNKLVLFNNNIFITNCPSNNDKYNDYLNKNLPKLDCSLKKLNLCFTYDKRNQNSLEQLRLSPAIKISLIKLDLSFCGLSTDLVINFLKKNFGLFSLQKLKLDYNNIEGDIFIKLSYDEILLENLNIIDLSSNIIKVEKIEENEAFLNLTKKYTNLKSIVLRNTTFFESWDYHVSSDCDDSEKYREAYTNLLKDVSAKKRNFKLIIEEDKKDNYIEPEFKDLFDFSD